MNSEDSAVETPLAERPAAGLETIEVTTGPQPDAAIIWLHGLGADGHDFEPLVPEIAWSGAPDIRFVFPHAPVRPVTVNGGMAMRAWYDIVSLVSDRDQDRQGILQSIDQAVDLVERERQRGIAADRIVIAGFSQGGAIAIQAAVRYPERLAGLVALSTYLLLDDCLENEVHEANRELPVFMGHGTMDPMVPHQLGESGARRLRAMGYPLEWHSYPMGHAVCPQEVGNLSSWLGKRLD